MGVRRLGGTMVSDLLVQDGVAFGAVAVDTISSRPFIIKSKATIIATGGAGEVYQRNYTTQGSTGDGYALAYRVGAEVIDPEFIMFGPHVMYEDDLPMWYVAPCQARWHAVFRNVLGEEVIDGDLKVQNPDGKTFQERYGVSPTDIRELISRWSCMEVAAGRSQNSSRRVHNHRWRADQ